MVSFGRTYTHALFPSTCTPPQAVHLQDLTLKEKIHIPLPGATGPKRSKLKSFGSYGSIAPPPPPGSTVFSSSLPKAASGGEAEDDDGEEWGTFDSGLPVAGEES